MAKSLSERIAERVAKRKPNKRALNLAAFLANKSDIEDALNDRWSVRSIWDTLNDEGRINVSYQAFNNYVNTHIERNNKSNTPVVAEIETKKTEPVAIELNNEIQTETENNNVSSTKKSGFDFNSTPNKEDLI